MYQARVLGLVFAHETAHAMGLKAERAADAKAIEILWKSMLKPQNAAQAEVLLRGTTDLSDVVSVQLLDEDGAALGDPTPPAREPARSTCAH